MQISGDLRATRLNGLAPSEWVMSSGMDQIITGDKALLSLSAAGLTVDLLNGLQTDGFFGSVLRTEGDQHVRGPLLLAAESVFDTCVPGRGGGERSGQRGGSRGRGARVSVRGGVQEAWTHKFI